jgi:hypothetical protein
MQVARRQVLREYPIRVDDHCSRNENADKEV